MEVLPTSASWTRAVGLAGTPGAVRGAEHLFFFFFFFFLLSPGPAFRNLCKRLAKSKEHSVHGQGQLPNPNSDYLFQEHFMTSSVWAPRSPPFQMPGLPQMFLTSLPNLSSV